MGRLGPPSVLRSTLLVSRPPLHMDDKTNTPLADFYEIDDLYILCTKPPACVLIEQHRSAASVFEGLAPAIVPVFPLERSITVKGPQETSPYVPGVLRYRL